MLKPFNLKIVVFSGAGMSAESGIQTFRDANGLWENFKIEEVATPEAWHKNPDLVTDFYNQRRKAIIAAQPNKAHYAINELQQLADVQVITQNIDDLHERAGSKNVIHLHGNIRKAKSSGPNQERKYYDIEGWKLAATDKCPEGYRLRPHVVWFGEAVPAYDIGASIMETANVLIVIGTSLQVHPAAGMINYARNAQLKFVIDPKVAELSVPSDFTKIAKGAEEGMAHVFEEIKKVLLKK